jgi:hypothetical protein
VLELPAADAGCLYWSPLARSFVAPSGALSSLVQHFGCPAGVLPSIGDIPASKGDDLSKLPLVEEPATRHRRKKIPYQAKAARKGRRPSGGSG